VDGGWVIGHITTDRTTSRTLLQGEIVLDSAKLAAVCDVRLCRMVSATRYWALRSGYRMIPGERVRGPGAGEGASLLRQPQERHGRGPPHRRTDARG